MSYNARDVADLVQLSADKADEVWRARQDRDSYMNASEAAGCIRRQWYDRHPDGNEAEDKLGMARRGHAVEAWVVEQLSAITNSLIHAGRDDQVRLMDDDLRLAATPDGFLLRGEGEAIYLEIKSFDPRTNKKNLPRAQHVEQVRIGMALANRCMELAVTAGVILYVNANNFDDMVPVDVAVKPASYLDKYAKRARRMLNAKNPARLPREGKEAGTCRYCIHAARCGVDVQLPSAQVSSGRGRRGSALDAALEGYVEQKEVKEEADSKLKAFAESIKQELHKRGATEFTVGGTKAVLKTIAGRVTYDTKRAIAEGVDLEPYKKTGKPYEQLTVSSS